MRHSRLLTAMAAAALLASAVPSSAAQAEPDTTPYYWSLDAPGATLSALADAGLDIAHTEPDGTAVVIADAATARDLKADGHDLTYLDSVHKPVPPGVQAADTYYGGYHTVTAHTAHLTQVATAYPALATVYDIGDSWRKTQGLGGHDIKAICITKKQAGDCSLAPQSTKPRFSMIAQIHARELSTGEVAWKFIDHLTTGYGSNSRVTALLDTTEIWIVPIANPDGVDIVASGGDRPKLQRKNAHTGGGCTGTSIGVDLNRNSTFKWGGGGASTSPCAETYRGASAGSEPEVRALEAFFRAIHPDQRGTGDTTPAPSGARDVMITLHSYGGYVVIPWGWTASDAPNDAALRALGEDMADSNGYYVGNGPETVGYTSSGVTDDYTYGALGVASYTYEMGADFGTCGGFTPAYSCVNSQIWPGNRDALLTGAEAADSPYI
ncbi:M14 family zinc carboxypeptidase [Phytomonospora sp. NPDC050363]|uniref:M14 family zinc carboxypeptidase n=1 Tax=Phytomonospora sp. NPDC050363 TaxID=3155642 RepID=UPI0033E18C45